MIFLPHQSFLPIKKIQIITIRKELLIFKKGMSAMGVRLVRRVGCDVVNELETSQVCERETCGPKRQECVLKTHTLISEL